MKDTVTNNNYILVKKIYNNSKTPKNLMYPTKNFKQYYIQNNNTNNTKKIIIKGKSTKEINKNAIYELDPIESFSSQLENLNNINLLEKDVNNLYKWEHLFNNFRPISCYTTINNKSNDNNNKENKNEEFKSPILLVDLPENQMNLFFGKKSHESSRNKKIRYNLHNQEKTKVSSYNSTNTDKSNNVNHNIRPMSMYSPRVQNSCYYYSSVFSDYYKEDFKSFCNKMPILKAKLKIDSDKLKKEIDKHDKTTFKKEKILNKLCSKERILLDKQDLIIAAKRKNPIPLLKSIFKQNYPGLEVINDNPKMYYNTMKPYGNDYGDVDYQQNDRWKLSNEIIKMRNKYKNKNEDYKIDLTNSNNFEYIYKKEKKARKLLLSYYDVNDPSIAFFNNKIKNENIININHVNNNIINNNDNINNINNNNINNNNINNNDNNNDNINNNENNNNINNNDKNKSNNNDNNNINNNDKNKSNNKSNIKKEIINLKKTEKKIYINERNKRLNIDNNITNKDLNENKKTESNNETTTDRQKIYLKSKLSNEKSEEKKIKVNYKVNSDNNTSENINSPTLNNLGVKDEKLYSDYISSNCFPLKTSSDVGNTSYNKINKFIREKKLLNKLKLDYSLTQSKTTRKSGSKFNSSLKSRNNKVKDKKDELNLIIASKKIKPKKNFSLYKVAITDEKSNNNVSKNYTHWDKGGNLLKTKPPEVNYFCFNNYIETIFNKDLINFKKNEDNQYFYPMNAYNKLAGKYYFNDIETKNKNNKSNNAINNLFDYSRDEKENDEIDNEKKMEEKKENDEFYSQINNSSQKN